MYRTLLAASAFLLPLPAMAQDDITDALGAAIEAYEEGEIGDALEEIAYATQLLNALQAQGLTEFLPEPAPGWNREVNAEAGASLAFMGGTAAEATYTSSQGGRFTITIMADNPMVTSMAGVLGNSALLATMGQIERINRENFMLADNELTGLIGGRILVQAAGGTIADMTAHLEAMDFREMEDFGR